MRTPITRTSGLDTVLEKVGRSLSDRFGIRVVCRGDKCATNGRTIFLPGLPDELPPGMLQVIRGYLDHESGHILGKSNFRIFKWFRDEYGQEAQLFLNMLEDLRIEEIMRQRFPGSRTNLGAAHSFLVEEAGKAADPMPVWRQLAFGVHARGNRLPNPPFVGPEVRRTLDMIADAIVNAPRCRNTKGVKRLAERAWPIVAHLFPPPRPPVSAPAGDPDAGQKRPGGQTGRDAANDTPDNAGDPGQPPDQTGAEDSFGEEYDDGLQEDNPVSGQPAPAGPARDDAGRERTGSDSRSGDTPDADAGGGGERDGTASADIMRSLADAIAAMVDDHSRAGRAYRIWTTEFDTVQTAPNNHGIPHRQRMDKLLPHVAGVRRKLLQALMAEPRARWLGDRESGRVNPRALHRLAFPRQDNSRDGRVFRERVRTRRPHTAVALLMDLSGSMDGIKIRLAGDTALVFCEALSRLGIPCCVIGFATGDWDYYESDTEAKTGMTFGELAGSYRIAPLRHTYFKRFHESFRSVSGRFDSMRSLNATPLGESILFAARELAGRREERKVLFAITDGRPGVGLGDDSPTFGHAVNGIKRVERAGIDVALVGILENCVADLHHRSVVVNSLDDLPKTAMRQLKSILSGRSRRQSK